LSHAGQGNSGRLSHALDNVAATFSATDFPDTVPGLLDAHVAIRRLNERHLHSILVDALVKGVTVEPIFMENSGPTAKVSIDGKEYLVNQPFHIPSAPNAVHSPKAQLEEVLNQKWIRQDRLPEIIEQQADIISFFALVVPMGPQTHPALMKLLAAVNGAVEKITMQAKYCLSTPRPGHLSGVINPIIQTPAHSSCPSGHAAEARGIALALSELAFGITRHDELIAIADRIAENRVIAGVHFPQDSVEGQALAELLLPTFLKRMTAGKQDDITNPLRLLHAMALEELGL